jgi:carboxypeptidase T
MKNLLFCIAVLIANALASQNEKYARVRIKIDNEKHAIRNLQILGIDVDHGAFEADKSFTSDFSYTEIKRMQKNGFKTEILIKDVQKFYIEQNLPENANKITQKTNLANCSNTNLYPPIKPNHFHLGSYGGFYTYTELLTILDSMRLLYPNLISTKQAIDTFHTIEGRSIYWLKVSNHPDSNQSAKPQMIYTALHHAREPASISQMVYYLWYLLENYASNPQIKAIVDNTELYFVPCLNPDGYLFNINNSPQGGGMWRKNRRDNMDGTFGVDLNRNYGYNWAYDNIGSSNFTNSGTYRGMSGFSEPETRAIKWFIEQHNFKINLNYHSFSNVLIHPWGYIASLNTPDSMLFRAYGKKLTQYNKYRFGTCNETLGYIANGDANDWNYGEQTTKNKVFPFTPEVGPVATGFYPPASDITDLCADNLYANLNAAKFILQYAHLESNQSASTSILSNQTYFNLQNLGLTTAGTFTASIVPLSPWIISTGSPKVYNSLNLLQNVYDSIAFTLSPSTPNGQVIKFILKLNNGLYDETDTITTTFNNSTVSVPISTNSISDWITAGGTWNTTTSSFYSAPKSITDSPLGNYASNVINTITMANDIDLSNAISPTLHFFCKWDIEAKNDYVIVEITTDNGGSWTPLCGRYTQDGDINQQLGHPIYDGSSNNIWLQEEMPLDNYLFQNVKIRITLVSNQLNNKDGFYFDNMEFRGLDSAVLQVKNNGGIVSSNIQLNVFPNPANQSQILNVQTKISTPIQVYLKDITGKKIQQMYSGITNPNNDKINLNIAQIPSGIYFYEVKLGDETKHIRFIKE